LIGAAVQRLAVVSERASIRLGHVRPLFGYLWMGRGPLSIG
jgi:hypothetical protein